MLLSVNKERILTPDELFALYARVTRLMHECVCVLVKENNSIQFSYINLGAEVAAHIDRNKSIYKRMVAFKDNNIIDVPKNRKKQSSKLICQCMDLQLALLKEDKQKQIDIINNIQLSRMIVERFIYSWLYSVIDYIEYNYKYVTSYLAHNIEEEQHNIQKLLYIENKKGIDPEIGFGLIRHIQTRMRAVSNIYGRIHDAYTRITLGVARSQSTTNDYALDNYQEGTFGLMRAISSYAYLTNAKFAGYAKWWIRQRIIFKLKQASNTIKVSPNTWQNYARLELIRAKCEAKFGNISTETLAKASGYTVSHIENTYKHILVSQVSSLDHPLNDEGFTLSKVQNAKLDNEEDDQKCVSLLINKLPEDLQKLICLQYGLIIPQKLDESLIQKEKCRQILAKIICDCKI